MKPLFSKQKLPMLVTSLSDPTPAALIATMRNAIFDGTDAFMFHMEGMQSEHLNAAELERIFAYACDKPMFTLNYRRADRPKPDEQLVEEHIMAVRAGASLIDMMGDMFAPAPMELTRDEKAISRQRETIDRVHKLGAEVLMSSHTWVYMRAEEIVAHAKALESRGADFVKIAMCVHTEEEALDAMRATATVAKELKVPFLHICIGQHGKLHRAIGPMLGSCFALCVQSYTSFSHKEKPLLRAEKAVFENLDWRPGRNALMGTGGRPAKETQ